MSNHDEDWHTRKPQSINQQRSSQSHTRVKEKPHPSTTHHVPQGQEAANPASRSDA